MSERLQKGEDDFRVPDLLEKFQPLPRWLADRLLRPDEKVAWVRGPWFNPWWERYITHPALLLVTIPLGAICWGLDRLIVMGHGKMPPLDVFIAAGFLFFGIPTIFVLGIANGYFTRLVVTNFRIVCLQGYEICRSWDIDDLPPSLLRYRNLDGEKWMPSIDLEAVKTMLGASADKFTDAKTILSFGKQLDRITTRDKNLP
ncbi:MAG: hypothetical protein ACYC3I_26130 [Gemmataceae bacterium]